MKTRNSLGSTRSAKVGVGTMLLGAVLSIAGLVSTTSSHFNTSCPSGSVLIAKFNFDHGTYTFDSPAGNEHVVTLTGASASGAHWTSTLAVSGVIVKGGPSSVFTSITPPQLSGTFTNGGLPKVGHGNTPDISDVQFCGPTATAPSSTTSSSTSSTTHPTSTSTTTPYTTSTTTGHGGGTTTSTTPYTTTTTTPFSTTTTTTPYSTSTTKAPTTTSTSTTTTSTTSTTTTSTTTSTTSTTVPASSTSIAVGPTSSTTSTTRPYSTTTRRVSGTTVLITTTTEGVIGSGTTVPVVTSTTVLTPNSGSNLPFTGGQSTPLLILGILFLAGGGALTFSSARRGRGARA